MTASELTKPAPTSLVVRRTFEAPVDRVFDAWLSPDALRRFLTGAEKVLDVTVDPRAGGSYSITWDTPNGPWVVGGVYREIVKNERIVCTWTWEEDADTGVHESLLLDWPDEHQRHVIGRRDPAGLINSESQCATQVRQADADEAAIQCRDPGAEKHAHGPHIDILVKGADGLGKSGH